MKDFIITLCAVFLIQTSGYIIAQHIPWWSIPIAAIPTVLGLTLIQIRDKGNKNERTV